MDPALLRERELFKKKALTTPTIEKKKTDSKFDSSRDDKKRAKPTSNAAPKLDINSFKAAKGSSQYSFGVLAKIVKHMRQRHLEGDQHPLALEEILDETNQLDVGNKIKSWLQSEALIDNPKIEVTQEGKFVFKAPYKLKDRKSLLKLVKQHDLKGLGGILNDDIKESLPNAEKVVDTLQKQNEIITITRPGDKKKVLFYNSLSTLTIDEEFKKLWRTISVEAMDNAQIEDYLEKQGIHAMQDHGLKKPVAPLKRQRVGGQRKRQFKRPRDNEHLADVLETYEEGTLTQKGQFSSHT